MTVDWAKFNYENEVKISLDCLELCNQDNPELIMKYGKEKSKISKDLRDKKEELSICDAKLRKYIVETSDKKPTVAEIDAQISLDDKHRKLVAEIIVLEYDLDLLKECINAFRDRGNSLREERELLALGYWSGVSKTNGVRAKQIEETTKASEESRQAVNQKRRDRRTR